MKRILLAYIAFFLLCSCTEEPAKTLSPEQKTYQIFKRYLKKQDLEQQISPNANQWVVIPAEGCGFCIRKATELYDTQPWLQTQFITNKASDHCSKSDFICDGDKSFLNRLNLGNQYKPTVLQVTDSLHINIFYIGAENWEEAYKKVKAFDKG